MEHKPTIAQQNIFDFIEHGTGNGIIDAVAGAGKTTTLMGCIEHVPNTDDTLYCAFNTSIRKELQKKFHESNLHVKVCTIHSLGFQMLRSIGNFKLNDRKYHDIINNKEFFEYLVPEVDQILEYRNHPSVAELRRLDEMRDGLDWDDKIQLNEGKRAVQMFVSRLLDINNKYRCTLEEDDIDHYDKMVRHFRIFEIWDLERETYRDELECYIKAHQKMLKEGNSIAKSAGIIDFTDQLYLPKVWNLTSKKKYGFVFVDECQDLSKAQLYVVSQYIRDGGRLLAVGDPYQSIYGFAGADCNSFNRVKDTFDCKLLGLTDCFRCPQNVIQLAQTIRSDINGFKKDAGKIYKMKTRDVVKVVKQGDLVICRTRMPLRRLALELIKNDFKVKIHPDELEEFMGDFKRNFLPEELRKKLTEDMIESFREKVFKRNEKRIYKENENVDVVIRDMLIKEAVEEMRSTLDFILKRYYVWQLNTVETILMKLKYYLAYPGEDAIKISTIHRAKGLENDRVFILDYNRLPYFRELEWERIQERNLHYVAVTRPKEELYLVEESQENNVNEKVTDENLGDVVLEEFVPPIQPVVAEVKTLEQPNANSAKEAPEVILKEDKLPIELSKSTFDIPFISETEDPEIETEAETEPERAPMSVMQQPTLYAININSITPASKIPDKFYSLGKVEDTPYPMLNGRDFQKAKYWSVFNHLQDTEFSISNVKSAQNQDVYYFNTPTGVEIYQGWYKNSGQYNFKLQGSCPNAEQLMVFLNDESNYDIRFEYQPENYGFEVIHSVIEAACKELGICNTNIFEEPFNLVYCFKTFESYAYIKVTYNGKRRITTIQPHSTLGENDNKLKELLETLKHLWQQ